MGDRSGHGYVADAPSILRSLLHIDTTACFRIQDGRTLRLRRGDVKCGVTIRGKRQDEYPDDNEWVLTSVGIADRNGVVFRCVQEIRADLFFELVRAGEAVAPVSRRDLREVLTDIRCIPVGRRHVPVVGFTSEGLVAFAYWTEGMHYDSDLLALPSMGLDLLVIRARPLAGLMFPTLFRASEFRVEAEPVFVETDQRGEAQSLVEVV
jgi:hypothetical protein